jgi:hypothetical protein
LKRFRDFSFNYFYRNRDRTKLVDELRTEVGSFDAEITKTVGTGDSTFRRYAGEIETSSQ